MRIPVPLCGVRAARVKLGPLPFKINVKVTDAGKSARYTQVVFEMRVLNHAKSCFIILSMRSTRTLSVTLPPEMLKRAQSIAKRESRTMSELVREALRHYDRQSWWSEVNTYGRQRAEERGLREGDVERLVHESRRGSRKAVKK
jgi:CopG family transcriptional regulator/antitoxin EndoAI